MYDKVLMNTQYQLSTFHSSKKKKKKFRSFIGELRIIHENMTSSCRSLTRNITVLKGALIMHTQYTRKKWNGKSVKL